jgi:hypothetical protein
MRICFLHELDALGAEPLVGAEAVVGLERHDAGRALGDELADLLGGRLVNHRRTRDVEHDLGGRSPGTPTVSQRKPPRV